MTLIVGIKCHDGVVLAADSAATFGVMGQPTIIQSSSSKLTIIEDTIIAGVSGPVGLSQRFVSEIEGLWQRKELSGKSETDAMVHVAGKLRPHINTELAAAGEWSKAIGPAAALQSVNSQTLIALPIRKGPAMIQFDHQAAPEAATEGLPFVAIGGGRTIADPFLAFIRRVFWPGTQPVLAEGILAAVWTVNHAILTTPGGVSGPIHVAVLEDAGTAWRARELDVLEVQEHMQAIDGAEQHLARFRDAIAPGSAPEDAPESPPLP